MKEQLRNIKTFCIIVKAVMLNKYTVDFFGHSYVVSQTEHAYTVKRIR